MKPFNAIWQKGETSRQAHRDLPEGSYEREIGREGFSGPSSRIYHKRPPTGWSNIEGELQPRAFNLQNVPETNEPWKSLEVLYNTHVRVSLWNTPKSMSSLARNADGDLLLFIHAGDGDLFCDFGHLAVRKGDYIVVPRGTMWRLENETPINVLLVEATNSQYSLPDKGMLGTHAIFDPAKLDTPEMDEAFLAQQDETAWTVKIKKHNKVTKVDFPYNPLDAVGWTGDLVPVRINVDDILPVNSHRYHLPPSAHSTFMSDRFMVSTFVPRPFETDKTAIKVPFFHNNEDYDEVIFFHAGRFFSRDHIDVGMMTYHPGGITHGPHPGALKRVFEQPNSHTDEIAVMLDTRDPLQVSATDYEIKDYSRSWENS